MDVSFTADKLRRLKKLNCTQQERIDEFLEIISTNPNAKQIMMNIGLIDMDLLRSPNFSKMTGYELVQSAIDDLKIETTVSDAVSIQVFGYSKLITPADLDNWIDEVADTAAIQKMIADHKKGSQIGDEELEVKRQIKEKEIALDEVEEFY